MENLIKKAKREFQKQIFKFGQKDEPTIIADITEEWKPLGVIQGDKARLLNIVNGTYVVHLSTPSGVFPKHYHLNHEAGLMLKGSMLLETPHEKYEVKEGQAYNIPATVWHRVTFLGDINEAIAQFHPPFDSGKWEAY
jgi:quercetin dioxygenase-like cupin family protein